MWQKLAMTLDFQSSQMKGDCQKVSAFVLSSLSVHGSGAFSYLLLPSKDHHWFLYYEVLGNSRKEANRKSEVTITSFSKMVIVSVPSYDLSPFFS